MSKKSLKLLSVADLSVLQSVMKCFPSLSSSIANTRINDGIVLLLMMMMMMMMTHIVCVFNERERTAPLFQAAISSGACCHDGDGWLSLSASCATHQMMQWQQ